MEEKERNSLVQMCVNAREELLGVVEKLKENGNCEGANKISEFIELVLNKTINNQKTNDSQKPSEIDELEEAFNAAQRAKKDSKLDSK